LDKKKNYLAIACGVLVLLCGVLAIAYYREKTSGESLRAEIDELTETEKKSQVVRRISEQMEEIAYQQKNISDAEREKAEIQTREAEKQSRIANDMRLRAESEQQNALKAEAQARSSEKMANEQRVIAEEQRGQAEASMRNVDTLRYIALGRSLGSQSLIQINGGNVELGRLLAYASWYYTSRYKGDTFYPAVFNALSKASNNKKEWEFNDGGITDIVETKDGLITSSDYGELLFLKRKGDDLTEKILLADKKYNFCDLHVEGDIVYALSKDGTIVRVNTKKPGVSYVNKFTTGKFRQFYFRGDQIISYDNDKVYVVRKSDLMLDRVLKAPEGLTHIFTYGNKVGVFTKKGRVLFISKNYDFTQELSMGVGDIISFDFTDGGRTISFGTKSGMVYVMDYPKMKNLRKLKGHLSQVSDLQFNRGYLLTSSYDRTLKLWDLKSSKLEPITLSTFDSWLNCFTTDNKYIWTGDASGVLSRINVSPDDMAKKIQKSLTRDFTKEEWNYYIGSSTPMESFKQ